VYQNSKGKNGIHEKTVTASHLSGCDDRPVFIFRALYALYDCLPPAHLAVLAAAFTQLGDTLETLAAQKDLLES